MRLPLSALIGLVLTSTFLFVAVFAHWIAPYPIDDSSGGQWEAMSATHWLGTDTIGRDILSRLIYGAQITIFIALASSILAFSLGAFLGFLAAVKGGWIDQLLSRIFDLVMAIPSLIVATHGGGTGLPTQRECLEMLGCTGRGKVHKLAEIVAGVVLAGELSLGAAISSSDWVSSHEQYGRNR